MLVVCDTQQGVKTKHHSEGPNAAARFLLTSLKRKCNWFQAVMQALDCRHLGLQEFKPQFWQLKGELLKPAEATPGLNDEIRCNQGYAGSTPGLKDEIRCNQGYAGATPGLKDEICCNQGYAVWSECCCCFSSFLS